MILIIDKLFEKMQIDRMVNRQKDKDFSHRNNMDNTQIERKIDRQKYIYDLYGQVVM